MYPFWFIFRELFTGYDFCVGGNYLLTHPSASSLLGSFPCMAILFLSTFAILFDSIGPLPIPLTSYLVLYSRTRVVTLH